MTAVWRAVARCVLLAAMLLGGCATPKPVREVAHADVPRELQKVTQPPYVIEPPDILLVDVIRAVPKPPYRIQTLDVLYIEDSFPLPPLPTADNPAPEDPYAKIRFTGNYSVEPGGFIDLGAFYGRIQVNNFTLEQAQRAINQRIEQRGLKKARAQRVSPVQIGGVQQQVQGEHLVAGDGTINLGTYGRVYVTGMTLDEARFALEGHLSQFLDSPQVSVDVFAYNSKVYYVITQGTISGDAVYRLPVTGNETVLDAISQIQGLQPHSSRHIWISRPAPPGSRHSEQVFAINWHAITKRGSTATNYQILPGDRIYISEDPWITIDGVIAKVASPFERLFGFTALGTGVVQQLTFFKQQGQAAGGGF
jgi:polysaccharide export outer membrane protein